LLFDAALLGVPCVGSGSPAQRLLWPELVSATFDHALPLARSILTDAPRLARIVAAAREACLHGAAPDEVELAASLRKAHALRQPEAALVGSS